MRRILTIQAIIYVAVALIATIVLLANQTITLNYKLTVANQKEQNFKQVTENLRQRLQATETTQIDIQPIEDKAKSFDMEVLEFVVDYNVAQATYITLLQGILKSNNVAYPEFAYEELLKTTEGIINETSN